MERFITLLICWKFITDKNIAGKLVYSLPFLAIYLVLSTIMGDMLFLAVRLLHLRVYFVQRNILPIGIFLLITIPTLLIYIYDKNNDIDKLRLKTNRLNIISVKKLKTKAIIAIVIIAPLPLISLSIFSILIKLNII